MNVNLTPQLEEFVHKKVKSGLYNSASEVVRDALRLMEERDRIKELKLQLLREEIQRGLDDLESGRYGEYTSETLSELFEDVKKRGRARLAAKQQGQG
jgi:antitoxin ParD1/3/4